ncbi:MAG: glycosyltransferase family 39 protein [Thermoguttaceae bacterium]|nr:glycosyltransferase family 39 protein [Thermoguttaceae bacterium]
MFDDKTDEPREERGLSAARAFSLFVGVVCAIVAAETFLPTLCGWNYSWDVLEQIFIGREGVLGSYKHPAGTAWIAAFFWRVCARADFAPYLASALCVAGTACAVWRTSRRFLPEDLALFAGLSPFALWYLTGESYCFNNNIALVAFWSGTIWAFHRALTSGRAGWWLASGLFLSAALWSKYTAITLAAAIFLFLATSREARAFWKTPGPYLAAAATFATFLPQALFFYQFRGLLTTYAQVKCCSLAEFPGEFLLCWGVQLGVVAPTLICVAALVDFRARRQDREPAAAPPGFSRDFLAKIFLFPILAQTVAQWAIRTPLSNGGYAIHFWPFLATVCLYYFPIKRDARTRKTATRLLLGVVVGMLACAPLYTLAASHFSAKPKIRFFPGRELSRQIDALWRERRGDAPIPLVAGDPFCAWNIAVYSESEPTLDDASLGPWASDDDLNREGGVLVWLDDAAAPETPKSMQNRFPRAEFVATLNLPYRNHNPRTPRAVVGVSFVPPSDARGPACQISD